MRSADLSTIFRIILIAPILYLVIIKINPIITILLLALSITLDGLDGYLAIRETSNNTISFFSYVEYSLFKKHSKKINNLKSDIEKQVRYAPRFDVAGDRITEYSLWVLFAYLQVIPLFLIVAIIIRHSIVDAFMGPRGTSSKMKTKFAKDIYSSTLGRGGINVIKFVTFSYLVLVYVSGYPKNLGYFLVTLLVLYIMLRGVAEIKEAMQNS